MSIRLALSIGVVVGLASAFPRAQNAPAGQVPTFRSSVRLLQIDAVVRDDNGRFVPHLTKDDFELLEDGKPQEILTVSEVNLPLDTRGRPAATVDAGAASAATGIEADAGRVYVMVLSAGGQTRQIAREFVENYFGPTDLMAVLSGGVAVTQGLSGDKANLLDAIDHAPAASVASSLAELLEPQKREPCEGANERIRSLRMLREVVVNLSAVGGRRKAILYFSGIVGVGFDFEDCTPVRREYDEMVRTAVRNDVRIYPIDPRGFTVGFEKPDSGVRNPGELGGIIGNLPQTGLHQVNDTPPPPGANLGLGGTVNGMMVSASPGHAGATMAARILANDTGGTAIANTGNFSGGFTRIVRDNSEYYVVSYYSSTPRDGAFHRVNVSVRNRPALEIRARSGYTAAAPDQKGKAVRPPKLLSASARDVLSGTTAHNDLPLEIFTSVYQAAGYQGSVLIGAHLPGTSLHLAANDRIELSYAAIDRWGTMRAVERRAFTLTMNDTMRARVAQSGVRLFGRIQLPRGTYQIRVAASQPGGGTGAATADVEIPDYTDLPLSISDVVVSSALGRSLLTLEEDPVMRQALPAQPTAARRFARADTITPFAEIFDTHWILTRELGVTSTVRASDGRVVARQEQTLRSASRGRFYYKADVPLQSFAPGTYVLNLEVFTRDGVPASASQEMAFEVE
jgi:VWFA-related protein